MQIAIVVIDSGGIGEAPDSARFGDPGANTIGHAVAAAQGPPLPHLAAMGLSRLVPLAGTGPVSLEGVAYPVHPAANGKDTLAGHWEMMGILVSEPFRTYPDGFPPIVVQALERAFGRPILGNVAASGTDIMAALGEEHIKTGWPIVYTSADSVLQIAAHEDVVPVDLLYRWCAAARDIMRGEHLVGRIIARPFTGVAGAFRRTSGRHDFTLAPPWPTMVDVLSGAGVDTVAVGKIGDIFSGQGFRRHYPTIDYLDGLERTRALLAEGASDRLIFTNLVEFDSHFGHRRDAAGYARALGVLDAFLPRLTEVLGPDDQLWITADHGCDPTYGGTDHTRETVPWLATGPALTPSVGGARHTLADLAATLGLLWGIEAVGEGEPARELVPKRGSHAGHYPKNP